jgi:PspA-Associated protein
MIIRISGEGQYRLPDAERPQLNELDSEVVRVVEGGSEDGYTPARDALYAHVREHGERVPDDELESSDVILPPADLSLAEAGADFSGDGLIPD